MFFNKEIKISRRFGPEFIEELSVFLYDNFETQFISEEIIEMDLIFYNYLINGNKVTIISEGMVGTSLLGKKRIINHILKTAKFKKNKLFM